MIRFKRGGKLARVTSVRSTNPCAHETGVVLDDETSAWPRGLAINLWPDDPVTEEAVKKVKRRLDWLNPSRFELEMSRDGNALRLEGVDAKALPPGWYQFELRLSGLRLKPSRSRIRIPKDGAAQVVLEGKVPSRILELNRPVTEFDAESQRILGHKRSRLDGLPAAAWLTKATNRDGRKACLLNLLAKLAVLPKRRNPFQKRIQSVFFAEADRIYIAADPELLEDVRSSTRMKHDPLVSPTHAKMLSRIAECDSKGYDLVTFRERSRLSMQMTFAVPKPGVSDPLHYVDVDIDLGNPAWDLVSFAIHIGELVNPGKTNHLKLRPAIRKATNGDFSYYDLVRS